jgi:protein-tyrosine phosphatase
MKDGHHLSGGAHLLISLMIDIHCHILPEMDDGPESLDETLEMCRIALDDGITTVVATPHQRDGIHHNSAKAIVEKVQTVASHLKQANIPLELLPGADVHIEVNTGEKILQGEILSINNTKRYFLLEFPAHAIPPNIDRLVFNLLLKNIIPVLTHPERILEVQENPGRIYELVSIGVLSQITAMSVTGGFGPMARKCASTLLKHNLVHIIASDAHSVDHRPPILSDAVKAVSRLLGEERAMEMVTMAPLEIIRGEQISHFSSPIKIQQKRFWFF